MGKKLLTIVEESDHDTIDIFGVEYDVLSLDDFGIIQQRQLTTYARKYARFLDSENPNLGMIQMVQKEINTFIKMIIPDLPDEVLNNIKERKRFQIAEAFSKRVNEETNPELTQPEETGTFEKAMDEATTQAIKAKK